MSDPYGGFLMSDHADYITQILNHIKDGPEGGLIFGLAGCALQLLVRREWPRGRQNEGSPQTLDPVSLAMAVLGAGVIGVLANGWVAGLLINPENNRIAHAFIVLALGYVGADLLQIGRALKDLLQEGLDRVLKLLPGGSK